MTISKEESLKRVTQFLKTYKDHLAQGLFEGQKEANTEKYIEMLFENLGWDRLTELERQHNIEAGEVDYSVNIDGNPQFLIEVKKHHETLDRHKTQALDYAVQAGLKYVILTNLREIRGYYSPYRLESEDKVSLFAPIEIDKIESRFEDLWLFSKPAFEQNLLEKALEERSKIPITEPITILSKELLRWRSILTKEMKAHPRLNEISGKEKEDVDNWVDNAVQMILNRIIFCRTIEDMGQIQFSLKTMLEKWETKPSRHLMETLSGFFREVDDFYNSGLFSKHKSEDLTISDATLKDVIEQTYLHEQTRLSWNFKALTSDNDILGLAYEQYLGTTLTEKTVRIKQNKKQRKKMGIYYTPKYVVEYVVGNALSEKLKCCKTPDDLLKIKVLDPACGSGSFLKEAYRKFRQEIRKRNWGIQRRMDPDTREMVSIYDAVLKNCIYGVDLDKKACEMAKLTLLIMAAEGGTHQLPNIDKMIRQGNSIIDDPSIVGPKLAFNWREQFPDVFDKGGFDVIIGNPPYDVIYSGEKPAEVSFYKKRYGDISAEYNPNLFAMFMDKGMDLLNEGALLGFIIPDTILTNKYFGGLRGKILHDCSISKIIDLSSGVFPDAVVDTIIFILEKTVRTNQMVQVCDKVNSLEEFNTNKLQLRQVKQQDWQATKNFEFHIRFRENSSALKEKVNDNCVLLGTICNIKRGMVTKDNKRWIFADTDCNKYEDRDKLKKVIVGKDASRYRLKYTGHYIVFDEKAKGGGCWDKTVFEAKQKILIALITGGMRYRINAVLDSSQYYVLQNYNNLIVTNTDFESRYILGLINSKLLNWYYATFFNDKNIKREQLMQLPIKSLSSSEQRPLINLVDQLLLLNKKIADNPNKNTPELTELIEETTRIDNLIDQLIYKIYGLTVEEIKIVEESLKT
jgi:type I restriction-modification system DNA methylase subunit